MRFIETTVFTRQIVSLLSDDEYRALQSALALRPEQGAVMGESKGLRKVRCGAGGFGKRGGIRVIYFFDHASAACYMLFAYRKSAQDDLTPEQMRVLNRIVKEEFE